MFKYRFSLLALIVASTAVSAQPWEEKFFNPKKLDGDIVLPMPCEGSMVFRVIKTNTKKPLEILKSLSVAIAMMKMVMRNMLRQIIFRVVLLMKNKNVIS